MIGIYKWTNKINNKVYVGQSKNIEARTKKHIIDSYKKGISVIELSKKYNVSTQSIYDIINHKTYKYLTEL